MRSGTPQPDQMHPLDEERGQLIRKTIKWSLVTIVSVFVLAVTSVFILVFTNHIDGSGIATIGAMVASIIGVIGTIVGSVVGHAQGATGREAEANARVK